MSVPISQFIPPHWQPFFVKGQIINILGSVGQNFLLELIHSAL